VGESHKDADKDIEKEAQGLEASATNDGIIMTFQR
jgi:hypothetical protein